MCTTTKELEAVINDFRSMKALQAETEKIIKALEAEIIGYMDMIGADTESGSDYTVKLTECKRETIDKKRLAADLGDVLNDYMKVTHYRRLTVK